MKLACIDCGSHSTRLLIVEADQNSYRTLHRDMEVTRLSQGVQKTKQLSTEGIAHTLATVKKYLSKMKDFGMSDLTPQNFQLVATAVARNARNTDQLFDSLMELDPNIAPEILDGNREAELGFMGATSQLKSAPPYLSIDIGGGSTEFGFGTTTCESSISLDIGSVNLTEKYIISDPPRPEELSTCLSMVEAYISDLVTQIPKAGSAQTLVGMAGTITTAAAVELGFYDPQKVHHFILSIEAAEDVFRTLSTEDRIQRLANPGLHPERVDVIVAGLTILIKTMRFFGFKQCLVSETDLMDGIILSLLQKWSALTNN